MKLTFIITIITILMFGTIKNMLSDKKAADTKPKSAEAKGSFYDFKVKGIDGKVIDFSTYKGKKVVVINVASKCGYTSQYADWEKFHDEYGKDIVVLGFPANNFMGQEPGSNEEIASFCQLNYGVSFQLFEKVEVIGKTQHPLFRWLSNKDLNGWNDKAPTWNFCKYVINEEGKVTHFFASGVKPNDAAFKRAIKG